MMTYLLRILILLSALIFLADSPKSAVSTKQSLTGHDALQFLRENGIYDTLSIEAKGGYSPAGRKFFQTAQITGGDGATGDLFGITVARDGDTILVGVNQADIGGNIDQGAAYVFTNDGGSIWVEEDKLIADDGQAGDLFGFAVTLQGDTAVIGAYQADVGGSIDQGATYIFSRSGTTWSQADKLTAGLGAAGDEFGFSVALDGGTALVGAPLDDIGGNVDEGGVYVFTRAGGNWTESALLTAQLGSAGDEFGSAVALDGGTALIGAPYTDLVFSIDRGAAYVFTGSGNSWSQDDRLMANDAAPDDRFGNAVALDGNTALIGAFLADVNGNSNQGAGYIFVHENGVWSQQDKLQDGGGAAGDRLGRSVSIEGDTALLGAPRVDVLGTSNQGGAYVFIRQDGSWSLQSRLTDWTSGDAGDRIGRSVFLDGNTALLGSINGGESDQGAVYLFNRSEIPWIPDGEEVADDGADSDEFGYAVALDGSRALVGSLAATGTDEEDAGAAYIFERTVGGWVQVDKLMADGGPDDSDFGYAVALEGDTALVGAPRTDAYGTEMRGLAYIFTKNGNSWSQQAVLVSTTGGNDDLFGSSVALEGDTAVVGAPNADPPGYEEQGAAYIFKREDGSWPQRGFLVAPDGGDGDSFGIAVTIHGNTVLVGASNATVDGTFFQGAVYVFTFGTHWTFQTKLTAGEGNMTDFFGYSVAFEGTTAVIGAPGKEDNAGGDYKGAVYPFTRAGTVWSEQPAVYPSDGIEGDVFGYSVYLENNMLLVGAPLADIEGIEDSGAAYLFIKEGSGWRQQTKLSAENGTEYELFGAAVALSGTKIVAGSPAAEIAGNSYQGKVEFFLRPPFEIYLPVVVR